MSWTNFYNLLVAHKGDLKKANDAEVNRANEASGDDYQKDLDEAQSRYNQFYRKKK